MRRWYETRRGLFTLIGVAGAGALIWASTLFDRTETDGYWARWAIVAAAGLSVALSQLLGGWTKDGRLTLSPAVLLLGFVPVLVVAGWVLAAGQPGANTVSSHVLEWSRDMHANGIVNDFRELLGPLAMLLGLSFGLSFDTVAAERTAIVRDEAPEPMWTDAPATRERAAAPEPSTAETRVAAPAGDGDRTRVPL
jgi:hypothetical protein